jgi:2-keto-3-deoxy-L-rhamnonate aldolase RhmA
MKFHSLRQRIKQEFLVGTFVSISAPDLVESMGQAGFDYLCLEGEHCAYGISQMEALIRAADIAGLPAVVRIAELGPDISRVLDLGAAGVMVPRIETVAEAREVVRRARYAPEGERGTGPGRATDYGAQILSYLANANKNILVIVQIETRKGLEAVEEITAVPGIDAVCVGPFDLSMAIGAPMGSPAHTEAVQQINNTAKRNGLAVVTVCLTSESIIAARNSGDNMVIFGSDRFFLIRGAQEAVAAARS